MTNPLRDIRPGDPIPTSAQSYNAYNAAARATQAASGANAPKAVSLFRRPDVSIQNDSGEAVDAGGVLWVNPEDDPKIVPDQSDDLFNEIILAGNKFNEDAQPRTAFVLAEPAAADGIVGAYCTGLASTKIDVGDVNHTHVQIKRNATQFESSNSGWPIVWKASGTGEQWAVVNLDGGGGGSEVLFAQLVVDCTPRIRATPGMGRARAIIIAPEDGPETHPSAPTSYSKGDFVWTGSRFGFDVINYRSYPIKGGASSRFGVFEGSNIVIVDSHSDGAVIIDHEADVAFRFEDVVEYIPPPPPPPEA